MVRRLMIQALFFYLVLSTLGTILRLKLIFPLFPDLPYIHLLHAHSHIAFLGWANVALMALIIFFSFPEQGERLYAFKPFFWSLWFINSGLVLAFLAQAYGPISIAFSTLSVVLSVWFAILYFRHHTVSKTSRMAVRFVSTGVILYVSSAVGLVMVALSMAAKIGGEGLFHAGVYFYLHSQYNGWMIFSLLGTLLLFLHEQGIAPDERRLRLSWLLLMSGFLPSYLPQIHFLNLPGWLIALGVLGTFGSWLGVFLFWRETFSHMLRSLHVPWLRMLFLYFVAAIMMKYGLEGIGSFPIVAAMIETNRPIIIGYLHLTLLGVVSSYIFLSLFGFGLVADRLGSSPSARSTSGLSTPPAPSARGFVYAYMFLSFAMVFLLFLWGLAIWSGFPVDGGRLNGMLAVISGLLAVIGLIPLRTLLTLKNVRHVTELRKRSG
ncbi:hypothetical protein [Hydrogenibacillus sp. N12]|uniref:hypothetical protein n=1 Tax=Hydrogenibacillus sp. N12 TaxID=2866627 RepID=UPI001C7D36B0|nr:hypothetical protein [Hydrogenibacillus sp. N12]QZA33174.1 hypothetical protein K2M58_00955 [Hydrogenibacillus sp. N12]